MVVHFGAAQILALLVGIVLPLVSALVTRSHASAAVHTAVLLGLSATTSFATTAMVAAGQGHPFDVISAALIALGTFGVGAVTALVGDVTPSARERGGFIGPRKPPDPPDSPPR